MLPEASREGTRTKLRSSSPQMANVMMQHLIMDEQPPERLVRSGTEYLAPIVDLSTREGATAMSSTTMTVHVGIRLYHFFRPPQDKLTSV